MAKFINVNDANKHITTIIDEYCKNHVDKDFSLQMNGDSNKKIIVSIERDGKTIPIVSIERKVKKLFGRTSTTIPIYIQEHFVVEQLWE